MNLFGDGDYLGVNFSKNEQKNTQWCEPKGVLKR
ncbi:hypothetical protein Si129_00929 [Streptococcus infantarius subsp. infantarius]|nr:hypothetical protein [Streptococcus infantarius subsp. infantarius]MCO4480247.1 hypothetical protein [Streptococcus infantarius subsp. infantarius]MCO4481442.1 hypothetical protein [Streptococcus infantarius subsp. infantarius]MCO4500017.1 hypothetical protein [Streptococcus infantarius subsp. infantarius]